MSHQPPYGSQMKASELLTDKSKWTQGAFARDSNDQALYPENPAACKFCAWGALRKVYGQHEAGALLESHIYPKLAEMGLLESIASFNDEEGRTVEEVRALLVSVNL